MRLLFYGILGNFCTFVETIIQITMKYFPLLSILASVMNLTIIVLIIIDMHRRDKRNKKKWERIKNL
jgi:hypothetical protein